MNAPSLKFETRQTQTLTPRLQYAVRLLQLSSMDYAQELHDVMGKNPFLETEEAAPAAASIADGTWPISSLADEPGPTVGGQSGSEPEHEAAHERDSWMQSPIGQRATSGESQTSALDLMVADVGLRAHLRSQANLLPLSSRDHTLICAVIESLDDDGYLRLDLDEVAALAELVPPADACEMNTVLRLVQSFEPMGVGARSVGECLLLQLPRIDARLRDLGGRILTDHLDRLAQRDVSAMARLLERTPADIDAACNAIRRLDPHPGWGFGRSDVHYVTPDVVVRKLRGKWTAQLNADVVPKVRLNRTYAELFQRHRETKHSELAAHLQEARWAVRNVEQRFSTILAVAQAILKRQYRFFDFGSFAMKPLGLKEIAEDVGLHESTVCRVTNNKYMATPAGVFELKHFFSRPMPMANGGACSATAIRGVIAELIAAEDPVRPLSDVDIAHRLTRQGLKVARRTVTKYRQMLKVPPVERRRVHSAVIAANGASASVSAAT